MKRTYSLAVILCLMFSTLLGQERLAVGDWGELIPYNRATSMTQSDDYVYIGCEGGILKVEKSSLEFSFISKVNGLNDAGIVQLEYIESTGSLFVVYENANIDIVDDEGVTNINDILRNANILTEKQVLDLFIDNQTAYIALDFGLVEFDLSTQLFGNTTFTNTAVTTVWADAQSIFIGTSDNIYSISKTENTADFSLWEPYTIGQTEINSPIQQLEGWQNTVYALIDGSVYRLEEGTNFELATDFRIFHEIQNIQNYNGELWLIRDCFRCNDALSKQTSTGTNEVISSGCLVDPFYVLPYEDQSFIWVLDGRANFKYFDESSECREYSVPGPPTASAYEIWANDGDLVIATGSVSANFGNTFQESGIYTRFDDQWATLNKQTSAILNEFDLRDVLGVTYDEQNRTFYFASYWSGLVIYQTTDSSIQVFDEDNSPLTQSIRDQQIRLSDVELDQNGNLWMLNYESNSTLSVLTAEGDWFNFQIPFGQVPQRLTIDDNDNIYIGLRNIGLAVYNPGDDIGSDTDDRWLRAPIEENGIPNNQIQSLAVDLENTIWVGTSDGPATINCSRDLECFVDRAIVEPRFLLEGLSINTIAIDGANRKWFGTNDGIFLVDSDNQSEINHFTQDNSPLLDDRVIDITIDPKTGILYIATSRGISTYRSDATEGLRLQGSLEASVFPNPVQPNYHGPITIKNLTQNAFVKITTISGRLVHEGRALGGQFNWNGTNQDGSEVSSGVYLVYSYNDQFQTRNRDGVVAKVVIAR